MTRIRDNLAADLELAGRAESTRKHYIYCAHRFVKWADKPLARVGESDVRAFLLWLIHERKLSVGAYLPHLGALRFLFTVTLKRPEVVAGIPWPKMRRQRPDALTRDEVRRVIEAAHSPFWRAFFATAYAAGLRRMEVARLRAEHIDAQAGLIRVVEGKGGKSREVMLDRTLLAALRRHWRTHALPGPWLFPARDGRGGWQDHPVDLGQASHAFKKAREAAGIHRKVTLHGLRHAFATHLLDDGVDLVTLQVLLGHDRIETTSRYTQVTAARIRDTRSPLRSLWP